MAADHLLAPLNPAQRAVVEATDGPVLVLAGAGSGKTRALTHRIAYLLATGRATPPQIFAVTFTNKAAREMRERVHALLGRATALPSAIGTFHSLSCRLLREQSQYTTRSSRFSVADTGDSEQLLRQALKKLSLSSREWNPRHLHHGISRAKNQLQTPDDLAASTSSYAEEVLAHVYREYQNLLRVSDMYDFDDLIVETIQLLRHHPTVQQRYHHQWQYLSVDEYQDTNPAQEELLRLLLGPHHNLCVVGDDYQAIYSWRGARVDHILDFERKYPGCRVMYLTQNYRSTLAILTAANAVISHNRTQKHKKLWTEQVSGDPVRVISLVSDRAEAAFVRQQLVAHRARGTQSREVAILYRTNAQSRLFEEEFIRHHLPYHIIGGFRFYDRQEIKDAIALLQFYVNPHAVAALHRLSRTILTGIGPKTLERLTTHASIHHLSVRDALATPGTLNMRQRQTVEPFLTVMAATHATSFPSVAKLMQHLVRASGYVSFIKHEPDGAERWENIEELFNVASSHNSPEAFLEEVALLSDIDESAQGEDRVTCMTLHAAKGLEFDHVYLVGCEEGLLPHSNSVDKPATLEEERRLLYVGMTRARRTLTLTYTATRALHGQLQPQLPSQFLTTLPPDTEHEDCDSEPTVSYDDTIQVVTTELGDFITHPRFGQGVVVQVRGSLLTCVFADHGLKTIDGSNLET